MESTTSWWKNWWRVAVCLLTVAIWWFITPLRFGDFGMMAVGLILLALAVDYARRRRIISALLTGVVGLAWLTWGLSSWLLMVAPREYFEMLRPVRRLTYVLALLLPVPLIVAVVNAVRRKP